MDAETRALLEHTRHINKTLSLFVFALQEDADVSSENLLDVARLLEALAQDIRSRAARHGHETSDGPLVVRGEAADLRVFEPSRESDTDNGP